MGLTSKDKSKGPSRQGSRNDKSASRSLIGSTSGKGKYRQDRGSGHDMGFNRSISYTAGMVGSTVGGGLMAGKAQRSRRMDDYMNPDLELLGMAKTSVRGAGVSGAGTLASSGLTGMDTHNYCGRYSKRSEDEEHTRTLLRQNSSGIFVNAEPKQKKKTPPEKPSSNAGSYMEILEEDQPLKKRDPHHENHVDDFPRFRAKLRSTSRESHHDACFNCLRTAVHCYNILILVLGLGVLGVGIWLLVTEYSAREVSVLVGSNLFEVGTYLMIAGGGTIALLAFCGCCGTMREDRCVLAFYGITLTIVLIALCVGSGVTFVFRGYLSDNIKRHFLATLTDKYGVDLRRNSENRLITDAWDSMQRRLECCGAHGNINSSFSWAVYKGHSKWYHQQNLRVPLVPDSCCKDKNKSVCNGVTQIDGPPTFGPPVTPNKKKNEFLNTDGCFDKLVIHMNRNSLILGVIAAAVPVLLLVGIIIVFCLCARVKKSDDEVDL